MNKTVFIVGSYSGLGRHLLHRFETEQGALQHIEDLLECYEPHEITFYEATPRQLPESNNDT